MIMSRFLLFLFTVFWNVEHSYIPGPVTVLYIISYTPPPTPYLDKRTLSEYVWLFTLECPYGTALPQCSYLVLPNLPNFPQFLVFPHMPSFPQCLVFPNMICFSPCV